MVQNQIKNPQSGTVPKVKGPEMNDRDILNDLLATEKYLTDNYNTFVRETSYPVLHNDVKTILNESHQCVRQAFEAMWQRGWYSFEGAQRQQIQQTQQTFSNYQTQFPFQGGTV